MAYLQKFKFAFIAVLLGAALIGLAGCTMARAPDGLSLSPVGGQPLPAGKSAFRFSAWDGPDLRVWTYIPPAVEETTPVLFVMHGTNRDADRYRDEWAGIAAEYNAILVVPEFSRRDFPEANAYNLGYVLTGEKGISRPRALWAFSAIEPIFDEIRQRTGTQVKTYSMYGHSAGAQFVHRYVYFVPQARLNRAVAANAGWYTLPSLDVAYPYGLAGTGVTDTELSAALKQRLLVLLGTADTDPAASGLRLTAEAAAQGPHRFARGHYFVNAGRLAAESGAVSFGWQVGHAQGVGHSNGRMAEFAAPHLNLQSE